MSLLELCLILEIYENMIFDIFHIINDAMNENYTPEQQRPCILLENVGVQPRAFSAKVTCKY